jgi:hypothetical protein
LPDSLEAFPAKGFVAEPDGIESHHRLDARLADVGLGATAWDALIFWRAQELPG